MFYDECSLKKGVTERVVLSVLFTALFALSGHAQDDGKPSAFMNYAEGHPLVFIVGIMVGVLIAVFAVYFFFMRPTKKKSDPGFKPENQKNTVIRSTGDRRYTGKRHIATQGGFGRK